MTAPHGSPAAAIIDHPHLEEAEFLRFGGFVTQKLGIRMPKVKLLMVQSRLLRRLRELGISSFHDYQEYLFNSPNAEEEQIHFIDLITTNKTEFYREADHFDFLTKRILPNWGKERFVLWSAGCATGEEAYTLAMLLADHEAKTPNFAFSILATDISSRALDWGRDAIYDETRIAPVPVMQRRRHMLRSREEGSPLVRMAPELRARVHFHSLNLMDQVYPVDRGLPVIFFRNVMIYFNRDTQLSVLGRLCTHLREGGHIFISHTESIIGGNLPLLQVAPSVFRKQS